MQKRFIGLVLILSLTNIISCGEKPNFGDELAPEIFSNNNFAECTIYNGEHTHHYLIAERVQRMGSNIRNISLVRYTLFTDAKQGVWQFIPVANLPNGFFLRNMKFGEDLFATNDFAGINQKRRELFTWRYQKSYHLNEKSFMWILKRTEFDSNKYSIWNVGYKEPMYAGTYLWKGGVYTWHKDKLEGQQFFWTLKCKNKLPI